MLKVNFRRLRSQLLRIALSLWKSAKSNEQHLVQGLLFESRLFSVMN